MSLFRLARPGVSRGLLHRVGVFPAALRNFTKPSSTALDAEDELKHLASYQKHRVEVAPRLAGIDENMTFEHPKRWRDSDPGHDLVGPGHGRHQMRTLASLTMEGKVCVVTGAGRGLGNMMARTFVESGADKVVLVDLKQGEAESAAKDLVDWFVTHGEAKDGEIQAVGLGCDVSSEESVKATFAKIKDVFGRVDVLVTAAGIVENFSAHEYPTPKIRKLMDINVMGTWHCSLEAANLMPHGGSIIMVGSMSGDVVNIPQPQTPYNVSKAAVRHMARSLAVEWAKQNIRVNCISPGYVLTNLTKVIIDENPTLRDEWLHRIPMGRMADPSDVSCSSVQLVPVEPLLSSERLRSLKGLIVLLGSDASKYITGADHRVDGGYTLI
ncbi:MAG: hypothetical protein TREMPRED_000898 [Tremellales sp. Tagirdzhanova-0007]|nr:MAG: hypothetical protein TREMPRED_000898 [Tremellales sp. Tagirdzhanova-0007]